MMGGDLPTLDDFSLKLITNKDVIECNQNGVMGSLKLKNEGMEVWATPKQNSSDLWVGIFNRTDSPLQVNPMEILNEAGVDTTNKTVTDVWETKTLANEICTLGANGVKFIKIN